jgi:hypothetical protein
MALCYAIGIIIQVMEIVGKTVVMVHNVTQTIC